METASDKDRLKGADGNETVAEKIEAGVRGEDKPMGKTHPYATAGLVALYPIALVIVLLIGLTIAAFYW
jgi:hypothetical protein